MIKISIITAIYNRASTILQSIQSVGLQSYPDEFLEHIVIDGGSTDGTLDVIKMSQQKISLLISEPDFGIYDALNKGFKLATGDVLGVMHSDDFYADANVLKDVGLAFSNPNVGIVYGDLDYVSNHDTSKIFRHWQAGKFEFKKLKKGWMPPHPAFFIRKKLADHIGLFNTEYQISSDYDAMLRYLIASQMEVVYIPRVLVKMRVGGESNRSLGKIILKMREDYLAIKENKVGGFETLIYKNVSKIRQLFLKN